MGAIYAGASFFFGLMTLKMTQCVDVFEIYQQKSNTNRSVACGICEARGGSLARRPELNDWEIVFGNWSHLETMDFWVDLFRTDSGEWYWGDSVPFNHSSIHALPMTPAYNLNFTGLSCALWNMAEPFYRPANCSIPANVLCQVPHSNPSEQCVFIDQVGFKFNDSTPALTNTTDTNFAACKSSCISDSNCWAADFGPPCRQLKTTTNVTRPSVPDLEPSAAFNITGKTCARFDEMSKADSDFVCNCGAMVIPETEAEKVKFVAEYKEEVKKELIVPTETISAQLNKKKCVPDERPSSTGIGFVGITMMVTVFGGLILLDVTSLIAHIKLALVNVKEAADTVLHSQPTESDA